VGNGFLRHCLLHTAFKSRFNKIEKKNETECVFRFIHSPHGLQKPFQLNLKKTKCQTECVFRFSLSTRLTKAVSQTIQKKNAQTKCVFRFALPTRLTKAVSQTIEKKKAKQGGSVSPFWKCTPKGLFWGCSGAGVCVLGVLLGVQRQGLGVQGYGVKNTQ